MFDDRQWRQHGIGATPSAIRPRDCRARKPAKRSFEDGKSIFSPPLDAHRQVNRIAAGSVHRRQPLDNRSVASPHRGVGKQTTHNARSMRDRCAIDAKGCADGSIITACRRRYSIPWASQANGAMKDDRIFQQLGTERHGKRRRKSLLIGLDGRSGTTQAPPERPATLRCSACPFFAGTLFHGLSKNRSRLRLPASQHAKSEYVA
ncbi:hypothetical protein [Burkholderia pseudomallei]|uniref:hypothetical protein n=1 Tax=Burkholderia pseudomallei TaxID=28450 RepID=UPI001177B480|nr:hypothetical protein [Burkholderia pseudomallei]